MFRCSMLKPAATAATLLTATLTAALLVPAASHAQVQVQRSFPAEALRGELVVTQPPMVLLNSKPAQLAPGARMRGRDNMLLMSASVVGTKMVVNYTLDDLQQVRDVWVLRPEEAARPWPATREQAARWAFDPAAQVWAQR